MQLEDGRFLMSAERYDKLLQVEKNTCQITWLWGIGIYSIYTNVYIYIYNYKDIPYNNNNDNDNNHNDDNHSNYNDDDSKKLHNKLFHNKDPNQKD